MKRSREVSIIVDALVINELIEQRKSDRARHIIKEAIKDIRREQYEERQRNKECKKRKKNREQSPKTVMENAINNVLLNYKPDRTVQNVDAIYPTVKLDSSIFYRG
ncbi:MAG: hypothetical protein E7263_05985 [Lachnospiraceae bacterium]|nr:hypothetical protein [Lachnospiraceae bacterium]